MLIEDGRAFLKEMRAGSHLAHIPVAVLTISGNPADRLFCEQHGVVGYHQKPDSSAELQDMMADLCRMFSS